MAEADLRVRQLLALKMEAEATSQGMQATTGNGKGKAKDFPLEHSESSEAQQARSLRSEQTQAGPSGLPNWKTVVVVVDLSHTVHSK